jgi:hypothetical protein
LRRSGERRFFRVSRTTLVLNPWRDVEKLESPKEKNLK